jgi:branched-chain amino acid transport system substrate-binding protein
MRTRPTVALAALAALAAAPVFAQSGDKVSDGVVKIGLLLDMSSLYADITGAGSEAAARMAVEDFGGKVLGKPVEVIVADHLNKADIAAAKAREWFDTAQVDALMDVAASATALAVQELAKERNKIAVYNGPGSTRLTNDACGKQSIHWAYDNYALAQVAGAAAVKQGGKNWFFLTADYAFGHDLQKQAAAVVTASGGKVLGEARHPINTPDFSSFLLQAQASKADVVGLANAGGDAINAIKQAAEFGLTKKQKLAGLLVYVTDVKSLGLEVAQGLLLTEAFYWDLNDETRKWSNRFFERMKKMPTMSQAGVYSATTHYLKAVQAVGTDATDAVIAKMKETPVDDFFARNGKVRADGRMVHDMYLFEVKKPSESKGPFDLYKLVSTVPGDQAFQPLAESKCPLVKKG